jgi:lysozyme
VIFHLHFVKIPTFIWAFTAKRFSPLRMKSFVTRISLLLLALPASALATNAVVNLSHYDAMRVDFPGMKSEGIMGVIHEASYPPFARDADYSLRQQAATRAGLLWGAYHYGNATDPVRQADHFLRVVSSAWAQADPASRPAGVLLVLDFEKNGHYPGGTMRVDQAIAFVERIRERTGKYPGIYSGEYHMQKTLGSPKVSPTYKGVLRNCWLWLANYGARPQVAAPWSYWHLWQYTGDGKCRLPGSGYPKSVANIRKAERNIFYGTRTALEVFWQERAWQPGREKRSREPERTVAER